jgi:uncharacterized SAM-binding protein YcdF (DUF218 family)
VDRKERWGLSGKGWLLFFLVVVGLAVLAFYRVYPFLAVTRRANTSTLIVEGWIHEYAIGAAINEFHSGNYERIFTTGGPIAGMGGYIDDAHTSANLARKRLLDEGVAPDRVQMVPSRIGERDRTYSAAEALRVWLREHHVALQSVNLITEDVHARRSRLLFQEALGPGVKVGIIAVPNPDYASSQWYRYSEGVREVISESAAYFYAKFLFWPPAAEPQSEIENGR